MTKYGCPCSTDLGVVVVVVVVDAVVEVVGLVVGVVEAVVCGGAGRPQALAATRSIRNRYFL